MARDLASDHRAVTSVVGKLLELAVAVAFVGVLTTALYGSVLPTYQTAAGTELADRTLATSAARVEAAVPPSATAVDRTVSVDLPATIRGESYRVSVENGSRLVLSHPHPDIGGSVRLALPASVTTVEGGWESTDTAVVAVRGTNGGVRVRLEGR